MTLTCGELRELLTTAEEAARLRRILDDIHEAWGEDPASDDETLAGGIAAFKRDATARIAAQDADLERWREGVARLEQIYSVDQVAHQDAREIERVFDDLLRPQDRKQQ